MEICLFGVLCSVNQTLYQSNQSSHSPSYRNFLIPTASPCPHIFQYKQKNGDWIGEVQLNNLDISKNVTMRVEITIQRYLHGVSRTSEEKINFKII